MSDFYEQYWLGKKGDELGDFKYKWPIIKKIFLELKNGRILDFGCGAGRLLQGIVKSFPNNQYVGADISMEGLKRAKKCLPNVEFVKIEDGKKLPFPKNEFDVIIAADVIEHVYDIPVLLSEWNRILKPNGEIVITTPYFGFIKNIIVSVLGFEKVFDPIGPHIRFFTDNSLKKTLEKYDFSVTKTIHFGRFYPLFKGVLMVLKKRDDK